jgi:hypothetical protein
MNLVFHFFSKKISTTHFPWNRATSIFLGKDQAGKLTPPIFFFMWLTYLFTFHKSCSNFEREIRIRAKKLRNEGRRLCLHSISSYPLMLGLCLTTKSCLPPSWKTDDDVDFLLSRQPIRIQIIRLPPLREVVDSYKSRCFVACFFLWAFSLGWYYPLVYCESLYKDERTPCLLWKRYPSSTLPLALDSEYSA